MTDQRPVSERGDRGHAAYADIAQREEFLELRRRYRSFAFPATIAVMVWYITYVVCNNWARDFMDNRVIGNINVAVVFGLLQFVSTFVIAYLYSRHAQKALDPLARRLQSAYEADLEGREGTR